MKQQPTLKPLHAYLVANGDLRLSANQKCWPEQAKMENQLTQALRAEGWKVVRAHEFDPAKKHGFIASQKMGLEVFRQLDPNPPLIVAEAVWQYSQHLLPGLSTHRGPILTVANWSGTWPGLVGLLNLNGSLTKMGVPYSTIWSETFTDRFFKNGLRRVFTWMHDLPLCRKAISSRKPKRSITRSSRQSPDLTRTLLTRAPGAQHPANKRVTAQGRDPEPPAGRTDAGNLPEFAHTCGLIR